MPIAVLPAPTFINNGLYLFGGYCKSSNIRTPSLKSVSVSRKHPPTGKSPSPAATGTGGKESVALAHLEKSRYRDAIDAYKALLKQERRPEWLAGLAAAYAGRARALAGKGMRREAIEIWRSRADVCGTPLWEGPYVEWLLGEGRLADVVTHLSARRRAPDHATDGKPDDELAALESRLAPTLLAADEALLARVPAESSLLRHRRAALAALTAYGQNDAAALEEALASIPFRSPYRDLRLILKAMVLRETDVNAARAAIARLPVDGPFERFAAPLRALAVSSDERLRSLAALDPAQQGIALDLLGCPQAHAPLLRALIAADDKLTPAALFDLVLRHSRGLSGAVATRVWQRLSPWAKRRGCESPPIFGSPSPGAEECATALVQDIAGDLDHAETHWTDAAKRLGAGGDSDDRLRAALILRHTALSSHHLSRDGILDHAGAELLTGSLQFDVHDRDVHIRLIKFWRGHGDLKKARARLDFGLVYFPDDVAMLAEAVETALAGGAFKKAATSARRLLELDPLNSKVRSHVGNAHLSHAGKQIAAGKWDAARKEIEEAATWLDTAVERGRMQALRAWTEAVGSTERVRLTREAATCWGGGMAAGWRLLREAQGIFPRVNAALLLGEAGIDPAQASTSADILALTHVLEQEPFLARKGVDPLSPWRKAIGAKAAALAHDAAATMRICEAFSRHQEHDLVEQLAEAARKRWPGQAIFVYHAVAARFGKRNSIAADRDFDDLEDAYRRAGDENDLRLKMRIDALFEADNPPLAPLDMGAAGAPFDPASIDESSIRAMIEMTIQIGGEKTFLAKARENLGSEVLRRIEKECDGNRKAFLKRIVDRVVESMFVPFGAPPPFIPARIVKPKTPAAGQGSLFDE